MNRCVVLFSGGTDSLCSAALVAAEFDEIHLLTFFEKATEKSPVPTENVERLRKKYGSGKYIHSVISIDLFLKKICYENYFNNLFKFHFYNLAVPGLSSLSWHIATITYCRKHGIQTVFDGMTKELMHLPGHMFEVRELFRKMYLDMGIIFSSPVESWEVPEDQQFLDQLIIDRHGFYKGISCKKRSTGQWLYENGILPHPNVKGTQFDRLMQHDCYPFVVYNMCVFWLVSAIIGYDRFKIKLVEFMAYKISVAQKMRNEK